MNILIVDDSIITLERVVVEIKELNFVQHVWQANDGFSALESVKQHKPDVIILDIRMPGKSGLAVLDEVKQLIYAPIVIINTFYPYPQYKDRALEAQADYFFDKTKDFPELIDTLRFLGKTKFTGRYNEESSKIGSSKSG